MNHHAGTILVFGRVAFALVIIGVAGDANAAEDPSVILGKYAVIQDAFQQDYKVDANKNGVGEYGALTEIVKGSDVTYFAVVVRDHVIQVAAFENGTAIAQIRPIQEGADLHERIWAIESRYALFFFQSIRGIDVFYAINNRRVVQSVRLPKKVENVKEALEVAFHDLGDVSGYNYSVQCHLPTSPPPSK